MQSRFDLSELVVNSKKKQLEIDFAELYTSHLSLASQSMFSRIKQSAENCLVQLPIS